MTQEIGDSTLLDTWAATGTKVEPDETKKNEGWQLQEQPPHEYANWLLNIIGKSINHILKNGVPTHSTTTTYAIGNVVQVNGVVYKAKAVNTDSVPPNINWQQIAPIPVKNSVVYDAEALQLTNDSATPGSNKFYGTDNTGAKGWQSQVTTGFVTGDFKMAYGTGEKTGYVRCNGGTIGSASSLASERANADTEALFTLLWETDSALAVSGGRGLTAAADWAENKRINLPDARNNVLAFVDGMGNSNTNRLTTVIDGKVLGSIGGAQAHALASNENAPHYHLSGIPEGNPTQTFYGVEDTGLDPSLGFGNGSSVTTSPKTSLSGDGDAHNNVQPTVIIGSLYIKL